MKRFIVLLILVLLVSGCATVRAINRQHERVDYSDGINKNEAIAIAQKQLMLSELKNHYIISAPESEKIDDYWSIAFIQEPTISASSKYYKTWYRVCVDISNGNIIDQGIYRGTGFGWGFRPHDKDYQRVQ